MENRHTILLTSAGGLTGTYLYRHFKKSGLYRIVAIDMSDLNPLFKWADAFYKVPPVTDKEYITVVKNIIEKEHIDIIIPVTSFDIQLYSKAEIQFEFRNTKMLLMDYKDHKLLHNKKTCYQYLSSIGIRTPKIYESITNTKLPCILKPIESSGSKNIVKIENMSDYEYWSHKIKDHILVEYIEGKEYTVDCLFNKNGVCLGFNVRERIKTNGGGVVITRNSYEQNIDFEIKALEDTKKIKGPVNFQFKRMPSGKCCIFDFNTRFASGGLALTVASGFDIPQRLIQLIEGKNINKWNYRRENNGLTMIKYYDEMFVK